MNSKPPMLVIHAIWIVIIFVFSYTTYEVTHKKAFREGFVFGQEFCEESCIQFTEEYKEYMKKKKLGEIFDFEDPNAGGYNIDRF
tara:strand:- start:1696 stop:1950 length:255 start_codon:yes stop_codon:yes gene_type:complete